LKLDTLSNLLEMELKDIYDAEKRLVRALPKMAKAASSEELRSALEEHLEVTKGQVERLNQVFENLGITPKGKPCEGMKGLIAEGEETIGEDGEDLVKDAAIIGAAQRVEHYEMAAYGTVRALAERLGHSEAAELLEETLSEEKEADQKLTEIAESLMQNADIEGGEETRGAAQQRGTRTRTSRA
jgi:ferritin-like metal-binding protein YciE